MRKTIYFWLLSLIHIATPSSAQNTTTTPTNTSEGILTRPDDVSVFLGDPAVFICGVADASPVVIFTLSGGHGIYNLTCPEGHVENIPQALYGTCKMKRGQSVAVWTIKVTSSSDNNTRVVCQSPNGLDSATAILRVYDNGGNFAILLGCVIGAFFGILLVFALSYILLQRSETLQRWFRGKEGEDDTFSIVSKSS